MDGKVEEVEGVLGIKRDLGIRVRRLQKMLSWRVKQN